MLFAELSALQEETSLAARERQLLALKQLKLRQPAHASARDVCHAAHRELLASEAEQASARKALDEAGRASAAAPLPPERARVIAAAIEQSNQALARAQQHFPACERAMQSLLTEGR